MVTYTGDIRLFAGDFEPPGFMFCDGRSLSVNTYSALYSLIFNTYGGDDVNFNIPDLRGRVPMGVGEGERLTPRALGDSGGVETVVLPLSGMPIHSHTVSVSSQVASTNLIGPTVVPGTVGPAAATNESFVAYLPKATPPATDNIKPFSASALNTIGESQPHENRMDMMALHYIICIYGVYPLQEQ